MRPVTERFDPSESHKLAVRATLLSTGEEVPVLGGSVRLNSNAEIRATADLQVADDGMHTWVPTDAMSRLAPFGEELRIERGIEYDDGMVELVSLAIVRIEQVRVNDTGSDLTIQITGLDRAQQIIDATFEAPYQIASGTNAMGAIEDLLLAVAPIETDFPTTTHTTPLLVAQEGDSRWEVAQGLAKWLGAELYFDGDGVAVVRPVSQVAAPSVLTVAEGDGGLLLEVDADWDRGPAYNRAVVTGENASATGAIPRGVATDEDPSSPTRYPGPFGLKPMPPFVSEFVTTDAQAQDAAEALLAKNLGVAKTVNGGSIVHPALEPLDPITVNRPRAGISAEVLTVDSLSMPLEAEGVMTVNCRTVRVTS